MSDIVLTIPHDIAQAAELEEHDFLVELAVRLYEQRRISMGKAREFARLDVIEFFRELGKRDISVDYTLEDLEMDRKAIEKYLKTHPVP